ncbi:MAG TPA: FAD-dependent oxidoreductase [Dehalococcoidia bacterium]|nr:FAD-dependent oxidoreductase [Dehalococcoidia bacterium]
MERRIGVYICHCGTNIAGTVDVGKVVEFARGLDSVAVARDYRYMCSDPGQNLIKEDIRELGLNRVVVASCSPRMHEATFRRACQEAGLNQYLFGMANIREHCSWVHGDGDMTTEKAKALVSAAVRRAYYQEPLETKEVPVNPNVLVVGGGIAGIQAALEIADSEHQVYLVEREPSIGGHMAQFDKTFPTLDCAACILTPKMTTVGQHPYIKLMSYSEVADVSGYVGNFRVKIKRKARYVHEDRCTGCGECVKACPVEVRSEFEEGLSKRKAIYIPFPQAVPNKYVVDKRGYPPCRVACPAGVNAQGYIALISQGKFKEALEVVRRAMPLAAVCGRVCTHPCEVDCERGRVDEPLSIRALKRFAADYWLRVGREKAPPIERTKEDKVAIIGSGPAGLACAYDLVKKGYPVTVFEALPLAGGLLRYGIPEYRLPGKVLDNEIDYIKEEIIKVKEVPKEGVQRKARAAVPMLDPGKRAGSFAEVELGLNEEAAIEEAKRCLNCAACSECLECVKLCEAGAIDHEMQDEFVEVEVGNIIVATGFQQFDPSVIHQYGYGRYDNVITGLQFERMSNASGPTGGKVVLADGREPRSVAILHCVGSRDQNYHKYCSRVCCMYSLKYSHLLREKVPQADIYQLYIDLRCFGKGYEEFYNRLQEEGVNFVRGRAAEVTDLAETPDEKGRLIVICEDTLIGRQRRIPVDMVILSAALEPCPDADQVARTFSLSRSADGFFLEKHPKLDPVATMTDGVFVAGCCQGPKDIPDTVAQASAAAARALATISKGRVEIEAATAVIDEKLCAGCKICNGLCPYNAISFDAERGVSSINEAMCKGCGACVAACPSGAIIGKHFTTEQIMTEIEGVLV